MRGGETSQACELAEITLGEHLQVCFFKKRKKERKRKERRKEGRGKIKKKLNGFVTGCEKGNSPLFHGHFLSA